MYNNEQKLKLHKVVLEHKNTLLGMDNCVGGCPDLNGCGPQCGGNLNGPTYNTGRNVVQANIY